MYDLFSIESDGIKLAAYEWHVDNPKYVICLIHGIGEYASAYDKVAEHFKKSEIATVAIDLRGHGCTPGKRGHLGERYKTLEDIDNMMLCVQKRYPNVPLILYGHSLGGNIVLDYRYKGKYADKFCKYIVTSPWLQLVRPIPKALYIIVRGIAKVKPDLTLSQGIDIEMLGNIDELKKVGNKELKHGKISARTAVDGFEIGEAIMKGTYSIKGNGIDVPMLLMHGSNDPICAVEGSREVAKNPRENLEYKEWDGYLHELHNGVGDSNGLEVVDFIRDWILPA